VLDEFTQEMQKLRSSRRSESAYSYSRSYPINPPQQLTFDELALLSDEDLVSNGRQLEQEREVILEARMDPRPWEEEIAYIRREQQIRRTRRDTHAAWWADQYGNAPGSTELN
jgi:hypothetical protein